MAYLHTVDDQGHVYTSFVLAGSRVAPKKRLSIPRLELSAALTGGQLAKLIQTELTVPIQQTLLWSDSAQPPDQWPTMSTAAEAEPDSVEFRKSTLVGITSEAQKPDLPDPTPFHTWKDLVQTTVTSLHGAAVSSNCQTADVEKLLLAQAQQDSFPGELKAIKRPVNPFQLTVIWSHSHPNMTKPQDYFALEVDCSTQRI